MCVTFMVYASLVWVPWVTRVPLSVTLGPGHVISDYSLKQ